MKPTLTQEAKDALIEALENSRAKLYGAYGNVTQGVQEAIKIVESFPTSDEGRWIPVEERLLKESELVMVYGRKSHYGFGVQFARLHVGNFFDDEGWALIVTHWQPLPKSPTK